MLFRSDIESSRIATEYCSYQIWRMNDGFGMIRDVIHNGLVARAGVVKIFWDESYEDIEEEIPDASLQDIQALSVRDDIPDLEAEQVEGSDPFNPRYRGKLKRRIDTSKVGVHTIAPEEFIVDDAPSLEMSNCAAHRTLKTRADLIKEGYDEAKVKLINWSDAKTLDLTSERIARTEAWQDNINDNGLPVQPELERVMVYETYIKLDLGEGVKLYKICHAASVLLDKEEVDRMPFKVYVPLPVPHTFYGNNFAARVIPTQNARTVLTRAILDHAAVTTNPRWGVVKGGLSNPKEMLDNRLGGIVNMTRPDAVRPLEQQNLNPFVFQTLAMLKDNKEESTGISSLSQGLNKDAISTQNSAALVDNLVSLSQQRQKVMARNFANFLVDVYLEVYRLVLENADAAKEDIIQVAGNFVPVKVSDWAERKTCKVALHLGYGERDRQAEKLKQTYMGLAQDPGIMPIFKLDNRFHLAMDVMKAMGLEGASKYLSHPSTVEPPQPDPLKVKELEIKDKQAMAAQSSAQAAAYKAERSAEMSQIKEMMSELKLHIQALQNSREQDRKDFEVRHRAEIAEREMALLEQTKISEAETRGIVSPS